MLYRKIVCIKREEKMDLGKLNIDLKKKIVYVFIVGFQLKVF